MSESFDQFGIADVYEAIDKGKEGFEIFEEIKVGVKNAIIEVCVLPDRTWRDGNPVGLLRDCQEYQEGIIQIAKEQTREKHDYETKVYVALIILTIRIKLVIKKLLKEDGES